MSTKTRRRSHRSALAVFFVLLGMLGGCRESAPTVRLATTTSTHNTGLTDVLTAAFQEQSGIEVQVVVAGTGQALELGKRGDVDLVLVHAREREDAFIEEGHGIDRRDVMWNDFVIVGPPADPAGIRGVEDVRVALDRIASGGSLFVSRGDDSGTHIREQSLWDARGGLPEPRPWYLSAGQGMGRCLTVASEKEAYLLTDRGTFQAYEDRLDLEILVSGDVRLRNPYGAILVNPERHPGVRRIEATRFLDFLVSPAGQTLIRDHRVKGEALFHPSERGGLILALFLEAFGEAFQLLTGRDPVTLHAVWVSLQCTVISVTLAAIVAIPFGAWLGFYRRDARIPVLLLRLGMSVPTVIIGLLVYVLISREGLLGSLGLVYTRSAIVLGELLLAIPLLGSLSYGIAASLDRVVIESSLTLGAGRWGALFRALGECRPALVGAGLAAFGRCLTELGIAVTVGGNLAERTRTLPSTIQLELSRGDISRALAAGMVLLLLALVLTIVSHLVAGERS